MAWKVGGHVTAPTIRVFERKDSRNFNEASASKKGKFPRRPKNTLQILISQNLTYIEVTLDNNIMV